MTPLTGLDYYVYLNIFRDKLLQLKTWFWMNF